MTHKSGHFLDSRDVNYVVKPKPACRHCGATLEHSLSKCPRCGRRSLLSLIIPKGPRT